MALARKLLDTTVLHVAEIGREVGYADPAAARRDGGQDEIAGLASTTLFS
jgi:AraC-like DNA-binding protein